jgi:small subunit ribosomal protein S17
MTEQPENTEETEETPPEAEAPAEEAPAEVAEEPAAEDAPSPPPAAPEEAPAEALSPKERRRRERSAHTETRPPRSPEERQTERVEERRHKAARRRAYRARAKAKRGGLWTAPAEEAPLLHPEVPKGKRKVRQGVVVSNKADKSITVRIDIARRHRLYGKVVRSSGTLHAHDERNEAGVGDTVRVIESRPLSRTKRWRLVEVLERAR